MNIFYLISILSIGYINTLTGNLNFSTEKQIHSGSPPSLIFEATRDDNLRELHTRLRQSVIADHSEILPPEIDLFLFHYLWKGSSWDESIAGAYHRPVSAFIKQLRIYHRDYEYTNRLLYKAVEHIALEIGVPQDTIVLSQTNAFKESLKFRSDVIEPENVDELNGYLTLLINDAEAGHDEPFFFIVTDKLAKNGKEVDRIHASGISFLHHQLKDKSDLTKQRVYKRFAVISTQDFKGLSVIYLPREPKNPHADTHLTFLQNEITIAGHTPTMISLWQTLLTDVSAQMRLETVSSVSTKAFDDFLSLGAIENYIAYSNRSDKDNPFVLTSRAFVKLIFGLQEKGLSLKFHDPIYRPFIQGSLERIEHLIGEALKQRNDYFAFTLSHELIAEEILLLVNILAPYEPEDFQSTYAKNHPLKDLPHPVVGLFASGSGASNAIIRGYKKYNSEFNLAISQHAYFELHSYISLLKSHSINHEEDVFHVRFLDTSNTEASIQTLHAEKYFPDIMFLENHNNVSSAIKEYHQTDTIAATRALLSSRPVDRPLTIVLDITLDKLHSKEVDRFLLAFSKEINEGRLHIILFRSAHKFDQLGMDKINAGYVIVYSTDAHMKEIFSNLTGQIQGLDYQFLTHLHTFAHFEIHDYNKIHYHNAERVYHKLCALINHPTSFLKFMPKPDRKLPFFDIRYPLVRSPFASQFQQLLFHYLINEGAKEGVAIIRRAGFGFSETTLTTIGENIIRVSMGSQCPNDVEKIAAIFLRLESKLQAYLSLIGNTDLHDLNEKEIKGLLDILTDE